MTTILDRELTLDELQALTSTDLAMYTSVFFPKFRVATHHQRIVDVLNDVAAGKKKRVVLTMPPRHGKSLLASQHFPAFYLGQHPDREVICATYSQDKADDWGREVRNQLQDPLFRVAFPDVALAHDSQSMRKFKTTKLGGYFAAGRNSPITGRGAALLVVDDIIKGDEEADSLRIRDKVKNWWGSVAYTRLTPDGAIVLIGCMTGDTLVLRPDGTETPLRDIKPGDEVATYRDGTLSTSTVTNWINHGPDPVFAIRTTSGTTIRANARHPFLVLVDGELQWIRLKNLRLGHAILRVSGESGSARSAPRKVASSPLRRAATACRTTTRSAGPMVLGLLRSIRHLSAGRTSSTATTSPLSSMTPCSPSRAASVPSAGSHQGTTSRLAGASIWRSITATMNAWCAACSATTATSPPATSKRPRSLKPWQPTSDFTLDEILEISPAGCEDVFDIEVAETENFIASGLVSHNTRWHDDDLIGFVLREHRDENWDIIDFPAVDKAGRALWPERFPIEHLRRIRRALSDRHWTALYQQRPYSEEGAIIKRHWWLPWTDPVDGRSPRADFILISLDTAYTEDQQNDRTACTVWWITPGDDFRSRILLRYAWAERLEFPSLIEKLQDTVDHFGQPRVPMTVIIEGKASGKSVIQELRRRKPDLNIIEVPASTDKMARAYSVQTMLENGSVFAVARMEEVGDGDEAELEPVMRPWARECIDECAAFPRGRNDDYLDSVTHALRYIRELGIEVFAEDEPPPVSVTDEAASDKEAALY